MKHFNDTLLIGGQLTGLGLGLALNFHLQHVKNTNV